MRLRKRITSLAMSMAMTVSLLSGAGFTKANAYVEEDDKVAVAATSISAKDIDVDSSDYKKVDEQKLFTQLFDINNRIDIDVDMPDEQLELMQKDYVKYSSMGSKSPIYRKADLYITITDKIDGTKNRYILKEVGVKMKGNTSRTNFYDSSKGGIYKNIHLKIDFQETFTDKTYYDASQLHDWSEDSAGKKARKNRTFAGLEKLEMKWNRNNDRTYIRDYYTNEFYRANGLYSAHSNIATTELGDTAMGVYTIYEPIDKVFIEKYLPQEEQGGDLYKCGWDSSRGASFTKDVSIGIENEDTKEFYCYDKKTNKKAVDGVIDHSALNNLITTLNDKTVTKSSLASVVDMEYFVKYAAVAYFAGNPDDLRNNYNNYYLYFLKSNNKAIIIPYDSDRTFGVTKGWNPTGDGMTGVSPYSSMAAGANSEQKNPIYKYSVCKGGFYIDEYNKALQSVYYNSYFTTTKFNSLFDIAKNNYSLYISNNSSELDRLESVNKSDIPFDNNLSYKNTDSNNLSFADYVSAIKSTYNNYKATAGKDAYYVVGTMNDWNTSEGKLMTKQADGTYKYTFKKIKGASYEFKVVKNAPEFGWDGENWGNGNGENAYNRQGGNWPYENLTIIFNPNTGKVTSSAQRIDCLKSSNGKHNYTVSLKKATLTTNGYYIKKCKYCGHKVENTTLYKASKISVGVANYEFNNKNQKVKVVVKDSKGKTISPKYYTITYPTGRKSYGKHSAVIKLKDRYSGTKKVYFVIRPQKTSVYKIVRGSKRLTLSWKKPSYGVSAYQIQYSTSPTFASGKTKSVTVNSGKTLSKRIANLAGNKKYYVRIRTIKKMPNGSKVYSLWSAAQKAVTLK